MSKILGHLERNRGDLVGLGAVLLLGALGGLMSYLGFRLILWIASSANSSTRKAADIGQQKIQGQQAQITNFSTVTTTATGTTSQTTSNVAQTQLEVAPQKQEPPKLYISDGPLAQIGNKEAYGIGGTDLIVKFTVKPNALPIQWEYFAYLISEALGLHVVPPTSLVNAGKLSDEKIFENLPGLKGLLLPRFATKMMVLQTYIKEYAGASSTRRYDLHNFQRVVFFELIMGRIGDDHDIRIDTGTKLWETSNSKCGHKVSKIVSNVWLLFNEQKNDPILDDLIEHILKLDPTCLDAIEKKAKEKSPDTYDSSTWTNIKENLALIQQGLRSLKSSSRQVFWLALVAELKAH
ncbi:MAG TPA: hypothetical protein VFU89_06150 [Rhabdochlamydiaceae bacterium]|nr:hypothetical protein [Rhabdochlamydiaceae bacterium]